MTQYTNHSNLPLPIAVWLAHDTYDKTSGGISATSLMKPTRQLILSSRIPPGEGSVDVEGLIKSRIGTAIHDAIERAWLSSKLGNTLTSLGIPSKIVNRFVVNPLNRLFNKPTIPIYLEKRSERMVYGVKVTGKFDFIAEGRVMDFKTTGTFSYTSSNKDDDYILQGSIYRWLNPELITDDIMSIVFIFSDWNRNRYLSDRENYPPAQIVSRDFMLLPEATVQNFVETKIKELIACENLDESELPMCSDKDLWRKDDVFKYYKNPAATGRSTRTFNSLREAQEMYIKDGSVGRVDVVKGSVQACNYCAAFTLCSQKDQLIELGELKI